MWIVWVACASMKAPPTSAAELLEMLSEPAPAGHPRQEPLDAYLEEVSVSIRERVEPCAERVAARRGETGVVATIAADGRLLALNMVRSSGSEPHDVCVLDAFRGADLPPPPRGSLAGDRLVTPRLMFR